MLDKNQAKAELEKFYPEAKIIACAPYKNWYLFRVEHPSEEEKDYDPFFSVDVNTGRVEDFSIVPVLSEIANLNWVEEA